VNIVLLIFYCELFIDNIDNKGTQGASEQAMRDFSLRLIQRLL